MKKEISKNKFRHYCCFIFACLTVLVLFYFAAFFDLRNNLSFIIKPASLFLLALYLIVSIPVHELMHYACLRLLGGVKRDNLSFAFDLKRFMAITLCCAPCGVARYRVALMMPFFTIGLLILIIGVTYTNIVLVVVGVINIYSSVGDLVLFFLLMGFHNEDVVIRSRDSIGFVSIER